jgi:hypothetical protein
MLGFKRFIAAITIAGTELFTGSIRGSSTLGRLRLKGRNTPPIWNAVLAA